MKVKDGHGEQLKLGDAVDALLNECRMILPGIQALFGFQLIAVFNQGFGEKLSSSEQRIHLLALALVALSGALVMAPAAYHRLTAVREASDGFIKLAGWLLLLAMIPLALGIGLDFYLIARIILQDPGLSLILAALLVVFFAVAWFLLPYIPALNRITGKGS
jgi:uncharacterized protein DUF6328